MLRIIAGEHRGRKLNQPDSEISRPTKDRTKEAVFSMIQFKIPGSLVLDLFSGSGALAIEAISRGAMKAFAVDSSKQAIEVINKNKEMIGLNNLEVRKADVLSFIPAMRGTKFDFVFMDPPYADLNLYNETLKKLAEASLLNEMGLIILETATPEKIVVPESLVIQKSKKYGKSTILLIANNI